MSKYSTGPDDYPPPDKDDPRWGNPGVSDYNESEIVRAECRYENLRISYEELQHRLEKAERALVGLSWHSNSGPCWCSLYSPRTHAASCLAAREVIDAEKAKELR